MQKVKQKTKHSKWFILINEEDVYIEREDLNDYDFDQRKSYYAYYSTDYMQTIFPEADILPPVNNEMQHCCIIRNK